MDDMDDLDPALLAAIEAAEAAVAGMADGFAEELAAYAAALAEATVALEANPPGTPAHAEAVQAAFRICHDVKGQAGSFGFDDAGTLCDGMCEWLRTREALEADAIAVLRDIARSIGRMADEALAAAAQEGGA